MKTYVQSPDPALRKSALTSLGLSVEGCSEYIRPQIGHLWPMIDAGLADPEPIVKSAACIAFGCLCEWLPEDCKERHSVLLPVSIQTPSFWIDNRLSYAQIPYRIPI